MLSNLESLHFSVSMANANVIHKCVFSYFTFVLFVAVASVTIFTLSPLWCHTCLDSCCYGSTNRLTVIVVVPVCLDMLWSLVDIVAPAHRLCTDCFLRWCDRNPVYLDSFVAVVTVS